MEIIVTEISEGIVYYQDLYDWAKSLDCDPDDDSFEPLSLMEGDPDKLKCEESELYFIDIDLDDKKYILTSDETTPKQREMLKAFHSDKQLQHFTEVVSLWSIKGTSNNWISPLSHFKASSLNFYKNTVGTPTLTFIKTQI